ncbi:GNAT family N-acetyltransferase [Microbacterium murale]|uniref:Acetyltransferase n=1 Tax=Microbacterium murale TaxID=1081040 RepID=A0ABU0PCY6_9MICO|nr:GNAT family N-acetyltransferase [Microbacterium murale]MDQ0645195.1 putative acetyltransferase [Microbacterium murale]
MWHIRPDDLTGEAIRALVAEHLSHMHSLSPAESVHALDLTAMRKPGLTMFTAWNGTVLGGMAALQRLDTRHGELKSMRTTAAARGRGAGRALLQHVVNHARTEGLASLSLETGTENEFAPARALYVSEGFVECGPFADYAEDPLSVFMTRAL